MSRPASLHQEQVERSPAPHAPAAEAEPASEPGNQDMQGLLAGGLRAKLEVGNPGDAEEREADALADRAMAGPAAAPCACGGAGCAACGAKIRRSAEAGAHVPAAAAAGFGNRAGRPLDAATRRHFEPRLGADLGAVRIHDDPATHRLARGIGARAFAIGSDIGFASGRHSPDTAVGRALLAHELAHVALGHGGVRRDPEPNAEPAAAPDPAAAPAPAKVPEPPPGFDPCAVDVTVLDNRELLNHYRIAEGYVGKLDKDKRKGEERYYDYRNLRNRLIDERNTRAKTGHAWLNADISDVPATLYQLGSQGIGLIMTVTAVDGSTAVANKPAEGLLVTPRQFNFMLLREDIPHINVEEYFAGLAPDEPRELDIPVPIKDKPREAAVDYTNFPFAPLAPQDEFDATDAFRPYGLWGDPARQRASFPYQYMWDQAFTKPVVTAGPFGYNALSREGFAKDWRGELGEVMFRGTDPEAARAIIDLNVIDPDFELFDYVDPRQTPPEYGSNKTQMPRTPGADPSLTAFLKANSELFGNADTAKRTTALTKLQANFDPAMTEEQMLRRTRFRVNPEVVPAARAAQVAAMRNKPKKFDAVLGFKIRDNPVEVTHKDGSKQVYNDIALLHDAFDTKLIDKPNYQAAVTELATLLAADSVLPGVGTAEGDFRPLLDIRTAHDFLNASEFLGTPDTKAGKEAARARQRQLYEMLATAEYLEAMRLGVKPGTVASAKSGAKIGVGASAVFELFPTISNWDKDPYAGRRYLANVGLGGLGGLAQGGAEYALDQTLLKSGLSVAADRAAAGKSVTPVATFSKAARFGGTSLLGGAFSGGVTIGGMAVDEAYFGADYSKIDYQAKGTRAFVSGSVAAGAGALASGLITAKLAGGGGAAGCTFVVPGVGTVACGTVGAVGGFLVGVGAYYVTDWLIGESVEEKARDALGEQGCQK